MQLFSKWNAPSPRQQSAWIWLIFLVLLAITAQTFEPFFPIQDGWLGPDFKLALPGWLDGYIWFTQNGLSVPWFTPSFCAGQPFFPDPVSAYYSLPQFLAIAMEPVKAAWVTLCIAASLLFWGGYLLMRKGFMAGPLTGLLVGGMLMLNGFLPQRMIIGHVVFHGYALVPWLALLLLLPLRSRADTAVAIALAGLIPAYWVHSGFSTLLLPAALSVLLLGLLHGLLGGAFRQFMIRGVLAATIGAALSASKLVATFSFMAFFPRTAYLLPGAGTLTDTVTMIMAALFMDSQQAHDIGVKLLVNQQWGLNPEEWAYSFGTACAVLLVLLLSERMMRWTLTSRALKWPAPQKLFMLLAFVVGLVWPIAFNYFEPHWNAILKSIPVINSTSTPLRWIIVYIPMIAVGTGLLFERSGWPHLKVVAVIACLTGLVIQSSSDPRKFYFQPIYYSGAIAIAHQQLKEKSFTPEIRELGTVSKIQSGPRLLRAIVNNTLVAGMSQLECYNPAFGYRREYFSADGLSPGPVLAEHNGFLNLKNPACYVYPKENNCKPGDLFRADQREEAQKFASYKPFAFNFSARQEMANRLSYIAWVSFGLLMLGWLAATLWRWRTAPRQSRQPNHVA